MITAIPTITGMRAATTPRNTSSDTKNRIGKAISSARTRSSPMTVPIS